MRLRRATNAVIVAVLVYFFFGILTIFFPLFREIVLEYSVQSYTITLFLFLILNLMFIYFFIRFYGIFPFMERTRLKKSTLAVIFTHSYIVLTQIVFIVYYISQEKILEKFLSFSHLRIVDVLYLAAFLLFFIFFYNEYAKEGEILLKRATIGAILGFAYRLLIAALMLFTYFYPVEFQWFNEYENSVINHFFAALSLFTLLFFFIVFRKRVQKDLKKEGNTEQAR